MRRKKKNAAAVALGRLGGSVKSLAKAESSRANGRLGGRPPKSCANDGNGDQHRGRRVNVKNTATGDKLVVCQTCFRLDPDLVLDYRAS